MTEDDRCQLVLLYLRSGDTSAKTLQNRCGAPFRRRAGEKRLPYGVQQPNPDRLSPPLLTVLLLLTGDHQEEGGGAKNERDETSGAWCFQKGNPTLFGAGVRNPPPAQDKEDSLELEQMN